MDSPTRPPNRSDGSTAVTATEESGGDPPRVGATGASAQTSRSNDTNSSRDTGSSGGGGEPLPPLSPARCRSSSSVDSLDVFQKRSIFTDPRRPSSGYFSFDSDSLPSSPLSPLSPRPLTADRATQTTSPSGQVMYHGWHRMTEAHGGGPEPCPGSGSCLNPTNTLQRVAAEEMQEEAVGQELRRIGDDYNRLLLRGAAGGHVVLHPNQLPQVQQEPALLLCMGLLFLVIGRLIYMNA